MFFSPTGLAFWVSGLNTLFVRVRVMSCPGCVLSGLCLSGLCPCPGYVRVRVMSVSGLCLCPGYVLSGLCLSGLCPVRVVSVRVVSCPGCVCPGCVVAPKPGQVKSGQQFPYIVNILCSLCDSPLPTIFTSVMPHVSSLHHILYCKSLVNVNCFTF